MITRQDLSAEQEQAFQDMLAFVSSKDRQMLLKGYAGTGKSTLIKIFVEHLEKKTKNSVTCTAPTNEAVRVVAKMTGNKYHDTIYSLLGLRLEQIDDKEPVLRPHGKGKLDEYDIIFIDESSMIHSELYDMIQAQLTQHTFIKAIYVGDDAQLPPVKDPLKLSRVFMLETQSQLVNVQRCAADNPIIAIATAIRMNLDSKIDQFERITNYSEETQSGVIFHDSRDEFMTLMFNAFKSEDYKNDNNFVRAIAYTNKAVDAINLHIRREIFDNPKPDEYELGENLIVAEPIIKSYGKYSEIQFTVGERLRVLKVSSEQDDEFGIKYWKLQILNYEADAEDQIHETIRVINKKSMSAYYGVLAELASEAKSKSSETFVIKGKVKPKYSKSEAWANYFAFKNIWSWVKYSYATTTHKSQGGTFKNVFVVERDLNRLTWDDVERNKLKYVAFTRASHLLRILQ